ncbi:hypothetical protein [Bacillus dakarensis]|uniref:hypothetical protein n=1 Tax=Robertmurraya dakarensis TaxID=1926278 RepID=UPI000981D6ED|nr:hypothetical protein [Bacillus dakarensis]
MSRRGKTKKMKRMSIYGLSAASVLFTTLWLKKSGQHENSTKRKYYPVSRRNEDVRINGHM